MEISGIHFLLTYTCIYECDHCFLYCGPLSKGTFSLGQVGSVLDEIKKVETINSVSFEGGEPFLAYPILVEAIRQARQQGLKTAIETNSYWATSAENAETWLLPLKEAGLSLLETSDDQYHFGETDVSPASYARLAAGRLGIATSTICIDAPTKSSQKKQPKGAPVYQGSPKTRGRAVDKLTSDLPIRPISEFTECPFENLRNPSRVHIDAFGNIHLCQGISMGNFWETPLSKLLHEYDANSHPICGPILRGGPLELAKTYQVEIEDDCVDACHFCSKTCIKLIDEFPQYLAPKAVYGVSD